MAVSTSWDRKNKQQHKQGATMVDGTHRVAAKDIGAGGGKLALRGVHLEPLWQLAELGCPE